MGRFTSKRSRCRVTSLRPYSRTGMSAMYSFVSRVVGTIVGKFSVVRRKLLFDLTSVIPYLVSPRPAVRANRIAHALTF